MSSGEVDAFFAGLVMGRGHVHASKEGRSRSDVSFHTLSRETAELAVTHFGVGRVTTREEKNPPTFIYRVRGYSAVGVVQRIAPYMVGPQKSRAESVLNSLTKQRPEGK
jgi:hypothetical protein